jgi:hypothetical protein
LSRSFPSTSTLFYALSFALFSAVLSPVKVVQMYVYLGTNTPADGLNWRAHVDGALAKAKRRSADLLWVCRGDRGIRPRTAVTLWKSMVRPLLEYGAELWGGKITAGREEEAERVQMIFLRGTLGLHDNGNRVANDMIRAKAGCELLRTRWDKLQLGYWRRLFVAEPSRLLRRVAAFRWAESRGDSTYGTRSWMRTAERERSDQWASRNTGLSRRGFVQSRRQHGES